MAAFRRTGFLAPLVLGALASTALATQQDPGSPAKIERRTFPKQPQTGPYAFLTNNLRSTTNFNVETVRGMDFSADGNLYAINTHGSLLVRHTDGTPEPEGSWPTLNNPVAMEVWNDLVLVVGGASHALALHNRFSGEVLAVFALPSEPGDIALDEVAGIAYIASQAQNVVVAIDVNDIHDVHEVERHRVPGEAPRFLYLDTHPITGDRGIVVAPMLSGNNTVPLPGSPDVTQSLAVATGEIANISFLENGGLPDEDLLVLPIVGGPTWPAPPSGREAGTVMLEHARNPVTNEYWALSVDLHNDMPGQRAESELRGIFADNVLAIFAPASLAAPRDLPDRIVDLDDNDPGTPGPQYANDSSVSFPYALDFVPTVNDALAGWAAIASSTGDVVAFLDPQGNRVVHVELPDGAIPRDVRFDPVTGNLVAVYCWGTNEVLVYLLSDLAAPPLHLELGVDPLPQDIRRGREIFYDARPSLDGRTTCASCHAAGAADGLAWKLSDLDDDQKDIMVTQSLIGIQDTPGYHWREERLLPDFNVAFPGLLGHAAALDEAPGGDLSDFVEFVFSLQPHANHKQDPRRILDDLETWRPFRNGFRGSAVDGQEHFLNVPTVGLNTCVDCHSLPNGAQGLELLDVVPQVPRMRNLGVAHLRQMNHKDQDLVTVFDPALGTFTFPRTGYGLAHTGQVLDIFGFADIFITLKPEERSDVAAYMHQFDQGIAPATHLALQLDERDTEATVRRIRNLLLVQAGRDWIDVVAFGEATLDDAVYALRWDYVPSPDGTEGFFQSNVSGIGPLTLDDFAALAAAGNLRHVVLGLPWGEGARWALDPDDDGLRDEEELALGTDPHRCDTDDDGWPDGYEVAHGTDPLTPNAGVPDDEPPVIAAGFPRLDHVGASYAKLYLAADEPVTLTINANVPGGASFATLVTTPAHRHTVVLQGLDASTLDGQQNVYSATIEATDLSGNTTTTNQGFTTLDARTDPDAVHVNELQWIATTPDGAALDATAEILVEFEANRPFQQPASGRVAVLQVMTRLDPGSPWTIAPGVVSPFRAEGFQVRSFTEEGDELLESFGNLPGPFLLSPFTNDAGRATVSFQLPAIVAPPGAQPEVRLSVQAVLLPSPGFDPDDPIFEKFSLGAWKMPSNDEAGRGIDFTF